MKLAASDLNITWPLCAAKQARLKQAKEEAEKEIAEFRTQIEAEFQRQVLGVKILRSSYKGLYVRLFTRSNTKQILINYLTDRSYRVSYLFT